MLLLGFVLEVEGVKCKWFVLVVDFDWNSVGKIVIELELCWVRVLGLGFFFVLFFLADCHHNWLRLLLYLNFFLNLFLYFFNFNFNLFFFLDDFLDFYSFSSSFLFYFFGRLFCFAEHPHLSSRFAGWLVLTWSLGFGLRLLDFIFWDFFSLELVGLFIF